MLDLSVDEFHWEKLFWEAGGQDPGPAIWLDRAWYWWHKSSLESPSSNLRSAHSAGVGYVHFTASVVSFR